jgi:hypothetical protein
VAADGSLKRKLSEGLLFYLCCCVPGIKDAVDPDDDVKRDDDESAGGAGSAGPLAVCGILLCLFFALCQRSHL